MVYVLAVTTTALAGRGGDCGLRTCSNHHCSVIFTAFRNIVLAVTTTALSYSLLFVIAA